MKADPKPIKVEIDRTKGNCKNCGKEFELFRSYRNICSYACGVEYDKKRGKERPKPVKQPKRYSKVKAKPGLSESEKLYIKNSRELKAEQKEKYGYNFCEVCKQTLSISTHHIIFRSEKPHHPHIHDKINLILVCGTGHTGCHGAFHLNKGLRNKIVEERKLYLLFGEDVRNK